METEFHIEKEGNEMGIKELVKKIKKLAYSIKRKRRFNLTFKDMINSNYYI